MRPGLKSRSTGDTVLAIGLALDDPAELLADDRNDRYRRDAAAPERVGEGRLTREQRSPSFSNRAFPSCEGFRMPARRDLSSRAESRRPKASREGTRGVWRERWPSMAI